jgi:hypothetical protein
VASQRVLQKNGFVFLEETEGLLWWEWRIKIHPTITNMFAFDDWGYLLPHDIVEADKQSVEFHFATNPVRASIWKHFLDFQKLLEVHTLFINGIWLDGSFVSQKEKPNDLDLVVFVEAKYLNDNYLKFDQIRKHYHLLHVFYAEHSVADTEVGRAINKIEKFKWFTLFSTKNGKPKGFIELKPAN